MKRFLVYVIIAVLIFLLVGCGARDSKEDIFNLVEKNYDTIITACEDKNEEALLAIDGVSQVRIVDGYVIVYCKGAGIAPSSQDYGFYYTEENSPVTVDCNLDIVCYAQDLSPKEDGYQCIVNGNTFYTEHIKGNIHFYSNAY